MALHYPETTALEFLKGGIGRRVLRASLFGLAILILFWIVVLPLLMVVMVSFRSGTPLDLGPFTLANYALTYSYPLTYTTLLNSLIYAGVGVFLGATVAALVCASSGTANPRS